MPFVRRRYYLGEAFVVEHRPQGPVKATAVVLLPPLGYEDTCAYRPLRVLADALAEAGHVVLRVDWPAQGDGALDSAHPGLVRVWRETAARAAAHLRARGHRRVAGIGVRAGGLLALASEGFDDLALWGMPLSGKALLREERAFHKMAARAYGEAPPEACSPADGSLEAGGFLYAPETVADLEPLVATDLAAAARLRRVLLLERDGLAPSTALMEAFRACGTEVSVSAEEGLAAALENSYHSELKPGIAAAIRDWLPPGEGPTARAEDGGEDHLSLPGGVTERPVLIPGATGELSAIRCDPPGGAEDGARWILFFNAGGIRRSGPNRLWTLAARELAAHGHPSLRLDVRDVGDSDGVTIPHADLEEMYSEVSVEDGLRAYDWLKGQGAGEVDVLGLCSGSFLGIQVAARRPVRHALLFNGLAFVWNDEARAEGFTSQIRVSLFDRRRWARLLTGHINAWALIRAMAARTWLAARARLAALRGRPPQDDVEALMDLVQARGTVIQLVSSQGDPSIGYLERHVAPDHRPPLIVLPGVDHTIRPLWAHPRVIELIRQSSC